ncbi:hypothetical protein B0H67DRAFT_557373 [Lasiosphaeris hirsuta]|uniref:Uncharacterized protein n=1 Tax=Lasiosphaeris hirsuta TaxID=260670 RepID=A0AA40DKY5_9PEZI|nr:hypothetical protein B0H67DRAFT_557373 [Lasiosphaeris hirsuta]
MTREGLGNAKLQECFQSSINTIAEAEAIAMQEFFRVVKKLAEATNPFAHTEHINSFSRVSVESEQLVEINDIQDELRIIFSILAMQMKVLKELRNHIRPQKKTEDAVAQIGCSEEDSLGSGHHAALFRIVDESIQIVDDNIEKVKEMNESAERVESEQQSSGRVPRYAMKLSQQGKRQNTLSQSPLSVLQKVRPQRLPMSFIASFFALGIQEFPKDPESGEPDWPMRRWRTQTFGRLKTRVKKWHALRTVREALEEGLLRPSEADEYLRAL